MTAPIVGQTVYEFREDGDRKNRRFLAVPRIVTKVTATRFTTEGGDQWIVNRYTNQVYGVEPTCFSWTQFGGNTYHKKYTYSHPQDRVVKTDAELLAEREAIQLEANERATRKRLELIAEEGIRGAVKKILTEDGSRGWNSHFNLRLLRESLTAEQLPEYYETIEGLVVDSYQNAADAKANLESVVERVQELARRLTN